MWAKMAGLAGGPRRCGRSLEATLRRLCRAAPTEGQEPVIKRGAESPWSFRHRPFSNWPDICFFFFLNFAQVFFKVTIFSIQVMNFSAKGRPFSEVRADGVPKPSRGEVPTTLNASDELLGEETRHLTWQNRNQMNRKNMNTGWSLEDSWCFGCFVWFFEDPWGINFSDVLFLL